MTTTTTMPPRMKRRTPEPLIYGNYPDAKSEYHIHNRAVITGSLLSIGWMPDDLVGQIVNKVHSKTQCRNPTYRAMPNSITDSRVVLVEDNMAMFRILDELEGACVHWHGNNMFTSGALMKRPLPHMCHHPNHVSLNQPPGCHGHDRKILVCDSRLDNIECSRLLGRYSMILMQCTDESNGLSGHYVRVTRTCCISLLKVTTHVNGYGGRAHHVLWLNPPSPSQNRMWPTA